MNLKSGKISFVLFFFLISFLYHTFSQQANYGFYDTYYTGALHNGNQQNYGMFSGFNFNLWMHSSLQDYSNPPVSFGKGWVDWVAADLVDANFSAYGPYIINVLGTNTGYGYRTVAERIKIARLCYGQRSTYECEETGIKQNYDFYTFSEHPVSASEDAWSKSKFLTG